MILLPWKPFVILFILTPEAYPESNRICKTELFAKTVNSWKILTILVKDCIVDVWLGSEYTSAP